jgi:hypothetical protein
MYIKSRAASFVYKIVAAVICLVGILLTLGFPNAWNLGLMKFYTVLSNVLCFVFLVAAAIHVAVQREKSGSRGAATYMPRFKGAVTIAITVTLLVYQFMLADTPFSMNGGAGNFLVHLLTPVLVILDWLLFDEKGHYDVFDPLRWTVIPLCYLAYALIAAPLGVTYIQGSRYPYFFLDVDLLGAGGVALYVLGIAVAFLLLGYLMVGLDRWMGRRAKTADMANRV